MTPKLLVFEFTVTFSIRKVKNTIERHYKKTCDRLTRRELITLLQSLSEAKICHLESSTSLGITVKGLADGDACAIILANRVKQVENGAPFQVIFTYKSKQLVLTAA